MNDIKNIQFDLLMVLLENDIIDDTHFISEREHVNTLEDVVNDMIVEYEELVNDDKTRKDKALNLDIVSNNEERVAVCEDCKHCNIKPRSEHCRSCSYHDHFEQTDC